MFTEMAGDTTYEDPKDVPLTVLLPAFITSELKTAFQIGFLLFLPFLVIDMVIASILMSLGMMMLSPMLVALPFKLLLFVLVDGWAMTVGSLVATYSGS
jgi:flagellar biosynthetic protein FliP